MVPLSTQQIHEDAIEAVLVDGHHVVAAGVSDDGETAWFVTTKGVWTIAIGGDGQPKFAWVIESSED